MQSSCFLKRTVIEGTFGDKEVHVSSCLPSDPNGTQVILLHGVHSSANLNSKNRFLYLAEALSEKNYSPWLIETSRKVRNRRDYGDDSSAWITDAFENKTFFQEQEDAFRGIRYVLEKEKNSPVWLWGFSLGGAIALSAAADEKNFLNETNLSPELIVLGGTGIKAASEYTSKMGRMPIVSTIEMSLSEDILDGVRSSSIVSFRGENDEIFTEKSCVDLLDKINVPSENKIYKEIAGANHSFRFANETKTKKAMRDMVEFVVSYRGKSLCKG